MLPVSTKDLVRFTPERLAGRDDAPVFLLKVPSVREKMALDAAITAEGVRYPGNDELASALRDGIREHVADREQSDLLQIVDEFEAASPETSDELAERINEIVRVLRPHHRPLSALVGERNEFFGVACLVRAQTMLVGIEGEDAPDIERRFGRLTDPCVEAIERKYGAGTVSAIGIRAVELTNPTEAQAGNSASPQSSPVSRRTSTAARKPRTARSGKSTGAGTSVTPSSPSPRSTSMSSGSGAGHAPDPE